MSSENILKVSGLKVAYGGIKAVKGIDLEVNKGELVTLIGANGAARCRHAASKASSPIWARR